MNEMNEMVLNQNELEVVSGGKGTATVNKVYGDGTRYIIEHEVKKGQNLTRIANMYNSTIASIMKLNPIITNKNMIRTGWTLKVCVNDK